jgi:hypothetical protein
VRPQELWSTGKFEFFNTIDPELPFEIGPMKGGKREKAVFG